jgi:flagellar secretion chaperone FliS
MRDPARMYQESAVRGASPIGLIVILYDEIVRSIRKAIRAFEAGDIEARGKALTHAVEVIGYLQSILNFEKGGDVARNLSDFYNLMRGRLLEIHIKPSHEGLETMAGEFAKLAAVWQQAELSLTEAKPTQGKSAADSPLQGATHHAARLVGPLEASFVAMES